MSFSFGQVVTLSGVNARTLDHWAATGFLTPSVKDAVGTGTRRVYSFSDVVAARAAKELRSAGISLQSLRTVVKLLRRTEFGVDLAEACLIVSGKGACVKDDQYLIAVLATHGQTHLPFTILNLGPTLKLIRYQADQIGASSSRAEPVIAATAAIRKPPRRSRQLSFGFSLGPADAGTVQPTKPIPHPPTSVSSGEAGTVDWRNTRGRKGA